MLGSTEWPSRTRDWVAVDMRGYEAVVEATHRYKEIFYEDRGAGGENDDEEEMGGIFECGLGWAE